jgi:very-short-patch-repair endonuclease
MRQIYFTDIEKKMKELLEQLNIPFACQYSPRNKYGYVMDFAIVDKKIDIETDGEAWHKEGNNHDRNRDSFFKNCGWKILRFRGQQVILEASGRYKGLGSYRPEFGRFTIESIKKL